MGQVIDAGEADVVGGVRRRRVRRTRRGRGHEIHIVDGAIAVAVDEIDEAAADALDRRNVELHGSGGGGTGFGAEFQGARIGKARIGHPERHGACARSMGPRESLRKAVVLGVDDEVDVALAVQGDILRAMPRHRRQSHALEQPPQQLRIGSRVFDELEAVGAHRIGAAGLRAHDDAITLPGLRMAVPNT